MQKSLHTLTLCKYKISNLNQWMMVVLMLCISQLSVAQTTRQFECNCQSDNTFLELIEVSTSSANEIWDVTNATGLALQASYNSGQDSVFVIQGIRGNATVWSVTLTNRVDTSKTIELNSKKVCVLPSNRIFGDTSVCVGSERVYRLSAANPRNINWTVSDGGRIVYGQNNSSLKVDWDDNMILEKVKYTALAPAYEGQTSGFCTISDSVNVRRIDESGTPALACNKITNLSLNGSCYLHLSPSMIIQEFPAPYTEESFDLVFVDVEADTVVSGPMIGMEYIDKTLEITAIHECSGNSCWGYVVLKDTSIPSLVCSTDTTKLTCDELTDPRITGFPIPVTATIDSLGPNKYNVRGFDMCSDVTLTYEDVQVSNNLCEGPYSSIIHREWTAKDISGNTSTCWNVIVVERSTVNNITFPKHFDDVFYASDSTVSNKSIAACGDWPKNNKGYPSPSYTGEPVGLRCMNVEVSYEDKPLFKCGANSYKILREWVVTDICDNNQSTRHTQYITVMDTINPVVNAPQNYDVTTSLYDCSSVVEVQKPTVTECSDWSYDITYKAYVDGEGSFFNSWTENIIWNPADSTYTITELPTHNGKVWINYIVTDACGNVGIDSMLISVLDQVDPTPVCDLHTYVAIGDEGYAYAMTDAFDDGSHDNCGVTKLEVRRMIAGCDEINTWSDRVRFCCADVGNVVMVQLRVWDAAGNNSTCMVEAEVQDNYAPKITYCPPNSTADCNDDLDDLSRFGVATAKDNCNVRIETNVEYHLNECGSGYILREFSAIDDFGNTETCTQRIDVIARVPFSISDIRWPRNLELNNGCYDSSIDPENLAVAYREPIINERSCSHVSFSYKDVLFQYVDDACFKVLRTWKVIDHCQHNLATGAGEWTYTQLIKIRNSTPPTFSKGCDANDYTYTQSSNCSVRVQITAKANDDCLKSELKYSYRVDLDNDGSENISGNGSSFDRTLPYGKHKFSWYAEDKCGNIGKCSTLITLEDKKAPSPYCITELVTVIMQETGEISINASRFDRGTDDSCGETVIASFSQDTSDRIKTITCSDLDSISQVFDYDIYFTDESGNQDYCSVRLKIQDNNNICGFKASTVTDEESNVTIGGAIYGENNVMMDNVSITIQAALPEFPKTTVTNNGTYAFTELTTEKNYKITPTSDSDYLNGVNTLDIVIIQRHILEIKNLDTPYKVIAADINNDGKINSRDLLSIRKLILGITKELPNNTSWKYVDAAKIFANEKSPLGLDGAMDMANMTKDYMDANFVAVKIGDVNTSNNLMGETETSSRSSLTLSVQNEKLAIGYNEIPFTINTEEQVYGLQLGLSYNQDLISDIAITSEAFTIDSENVYLEDGKIFVSVNEAISTDVIGELFKLVVITNDNVPVSEVISLDAFGVKPLLVVENGEHVQAKAFDVNINGSSLEEDTKFELFQNIPNPFHSSTDIAFTLPTSQNGTLSIMDITGKVLYKKVGQFKKGYNVIHLDISEISASGILHYQLDTDTHSATRKMIVIK